jgi:hypothetical protein
MGFKFQKLDENVEYIEKENEFDKPDPRKKF